MNRYYILIVDDEREVLESVHQDLISLGSKFDLELAESAAEASEVIEARSQRQQILALILCDHVMPGTKGVEFLVELNQNQATAKAKKLLITGQAGLQATIHAINDAELDYYITKPWQAEELLAVVKRFLTNFIIANEARLQDYAALLDRAKIFEAIHQRASE